MLVDRTISPLELKVGGPAPTMPTFLGMDEATLYYLEQLFDNVTGEELPYEEVKKARAVEMGWVESINLYESMALKRGIKPLPVRWVDVDK
eukprot:16157433-Heterocapsa_arctica.AAC.1